MVVILCTGVAYATAVSPALSLSGLHQLNADWSLTHQAPPMGVPRDYSWSTKPQIEAGNQPGRFKTITGWGHAFWSKDTVGHPGQLQIRSMHTFICSGPERRWSRAQHGSIEGAEYRADFKNNANKAARYSSDGAITNVSFDAGNTFHFWPKGRAHLPAGDICGVVVVLEARAVDTRPTDSPRTGGYLMGLGADYWIDASAPYDNFRTNKGVGLGRLKYVGDQWTWFGFSTASDQDLQRLHAGGLLEKVH